MHVLTTHDFLCFSGGATVDRIDKTIALADYPVARKVLHPCFKEGQKNCSSPSCAKCVKALLTLDYYNKLEPMSKIYDIKRYKENKQKYLVTLVKEKNGEGFALLHDMYVKKYPAEMQEAQAQYDKQTEPVARADYNVLKKERDALLLLLSEKNPRESILRFFEEKGIKKLYYAGSSKYGKKVIECISDRIEVVTSENGKLNDCDAGFVACFKDFDIKRVKKILVRKKEKDMEIFTYKDINAFLKEDKITVGDVEIELPVEKSFIKKLFKK